jgi:hypothetical protein
MFVIAWRAEQTPEWGGFGWVVIAFGVQASAVAAMCAGMIMRRTRHLAAGLLLGLVLSWPACVGGSQASREARGGARGSNSILDIFGL